MSVKFVQSPQVLNVNGEDFGWPANPDGVPNGMQIPCEDTQIVGAYWRIPQTQGPRVIGFTYLVATDAIPPTADAVKVLRVKLIGTGGITQIDMAIADADNIGTTSPPNRFAYLCDGVGGTLPVMPLVTIPVPIMQSGPQITDPATGDRTYIFAFPDNPSALLYQVNGIWFNGIAPTPAYVAAGITTVAGVVSYANTHWSVYGTFSNPSTNILKLVNTDSDTVPVYMSGVDVSLAPANQCIDLTAFSTPSLVDGVSFDGGTTVIPVTPFMLTNNPVTLYNVLKDVMSSGTTFNTTSVSHKLGILTVQGLVSLIDTSGPTTVVSATAAVCS